MNSEKNTIIRARVTAVHRERYQLVCEYGEIYARLKTKEYYVELEEFPTTGDFVAIRYIPNGDSQIIKTLPRKTFFSRLDPTPGRGEQAVAANFDYVFIMQSLNHDFNAKRLERYMTLAWQSGATPIVLLTKADLLEAYEEYLECVARVAIGVEVYPVSSKTGFGLEKLEKFLQPGKTVVFLGSSGVGKSSLVNALAGKEIMGVNGILHLLLPVLWHIPVLFYACNQKICISPDTVPHPQKLHQVPSKHPTCQHCAFLGYQ